jgi:hypothetical protein
MKSTRMFGTLLMALVALATVLPTAVAAGAAERIIVLKPAAKFPAA